jgi:hypothetical protein
LSLLWSRTEFYELRIAVEAERCKVACEDHGSILDFIPLAELLVFDQELRDQSVQTRVLELEFGDTAAVSGSRWILLGREGVSVSYRLRSFSIA